MPMPCPHRNDECIAGGPFENLTADLGDVPGDIAALDHGAKLAEIDRTGVDDLDPGLFLEIVEIVFAQ